MKDEDILRLVDAAAEPDPGRILDALLQVSGAERGFLVLRDSIPIARHMDGDEVRRAAEKVSRTLLDRALAEGRPIVATDADLAGVASLQEQKVRSVCVVPLRASDGAVYLDHRFEKGLFADLAPLGRYAEALDRSLARRREGWSGMVGRSKPMRDLYRVLERAAESPYPVLLTGESGSGKELAARALHRKGPFVAANCAVLPEALVDSELFGHVKGAFTGAERDRAGLFEQAQGGTLFLDEVGCLSPSAQESLLRVLETGELRRLGATKTETVAVRVVAATNEDLELAEGFRRDLYYRLNVLRVDVPPLRERLEDLPLLVARFLDRIAAETGSPRKLLQGRALETLSAHRWPGNLRELLNALRRAAALSDREILDSADFAFLKAPPPAAAAAAPGLRSVDDHIRETLERYSATMELQAIADQLGMSRKTLWEKKRKWGL